MALGIYIITETALVLIQSIFASSRLSEISSEFAALKQLCNKVFEVKQQDNNMEAVARNEKVVAEGQPTQASEEKCCKLGRSCCVWYQFEGCIEAKGYCTVSDTTLTFLATCCLPK